MFGLKSSSSRNVSPSLKAGLSETYTGKEMAEIERFGTMAELKEGSVFINEGTVGREAVMIVSGTAAVSRDGEVIATVGPGDVVGEISLLLKQPRNASLVATTDVMLKAFTPQEFASLLHACPRIESHVADLVERRTALSS